MRSPLLARVAAALMICAGITNANADEIKAFFPAAMRNAMTAVVPAFEKNSGHKVSIQYGTVGAIVDRLANGEAADLAVVTPGPLSKLTAQELVAPDGQAAVALVGIVVIGRKGEPKPDISSIESLRKALLSSKSIVYGDPGLGDSSGIAAAAIIEKLGITAEIKHKLKLVSATAKGDTVASGSADIGFDQMSNVIANPRIEPLGVLPPELQHHTQYAGGLVKNAAHADAAKLFIQFLRLPETQAVMHQKGFEPL